MRVVTRGSSPAITEESDDSLITPRGMAAPPAPRIRFEGDTSRPATIRIEATHVDALRKLHLERELQQVQQAAVVASPVPSPHPLKRLISLVSKSLNTLV